MLSCALDAIFERINWKGMTLLETIRLVEGVAAQQPAIRSIIRQDATKINERPDWRYGCFAWQQGVHRESAGSDIARYSFTLFYIDRLTKDKGNTAEVQSVGCEVLGSILRYISEETGVAVQDWALHPFTYRFKDECAGVYADAVLEVPVSLPCGAVYEELENIADFNADFNEDFQCWVAQIKDKEILIY